MFFEPETALTQIVGRRKTEITDPRKVVLLIFLDPSEKNSLIMSAVVILVSFAFFSAKVQTILQRSSELIDLILSKFASSLADQFLPPVYGFADQLSEILCLSPLLRFSIILFFLFLQILPKIFIFVLQPIVCLMCIFQTSAVVIDMMIQNADSAFVVIPEGSVRIISLISSQSFPEIRNSHCHFCLLIIMPDHDSSPPSVFHLLLCAAQN